MGKFPTLADVRCIWGERISLVWLETQIRDLAEYVGLGKKLDDLQAHEVARILLQSCYYLKLPEMLLFFAYFKVGKYGKFYGTFDPILLSQALDKFKLWRVNTINEYEQREQEKLRSTRAEGCCTREEALAMERFSVPITLLVDTPMYRQLLCIGHVDERGRAEISIRKDEMIIILDYEDKKIIKIRHD